MTDFNLSKDDAAHLARRNQRLWDAMAKDRRYVPPSTPVLPPPVVGRRREADPTLRWGFGYWAFLTAAVLLALWVIS